MSPSEPGGIQRIIAMYERAGSSQSTLEAARKEHAALLAKLAEARDVIEVIADLACEMAIDDPNGEDCLERNVAPEDRCVYCAATHWLARPEPEPEKEETPNA